MNIKYSDCRPNLWHRHKAGVLNMHSFIPLALIDKYAVLIVDDIGYVKKTEQESSVLFELIAHRYERHSLVQSIY